VSNLSQDINFKLASQSFLKVALQGSDRKPLIYAINAIPTGKCLLGNNRLGFSLKKRARHLDKVSSCLSSHIFALLSTFVQLCDNARTRKVFGLSLDNFEVN